MPAWHEDPNLKSKFHADFPDDVQVIVHDGGPRLSSHAPELMWVRIVEQRRPGYIGTLLNEPHALTSVRKGDTIVFLATESCEYPFRVTEKYLTEREGWNIEPCNKCGFDELFDAPSDLIKKIFPNWPEGDSLLAFTSFCPICRGVQSIRSKAASGFHTGDKARKWWQFWKKGNRA